MDSLLKTSSKIKDYHKGKPSYNYCCICGHTPQTSQYEPNRVSKWWDPDDGWRFGAICFSCAEEALDREPQEDDYAMLRGDYGYDPNNIETDEDIIDLL